MTDNTVSTKIPNITFNPLKYWPEGVIDGLLQHLSGKELIQASEVCTSWWDFIGASSRCMKKIKLALRPSSLGATKRAFEITRRYENLEAEDSHFISAVRKILNIRKGHWKCIKLSKMVFDDPSSIQRIVNIIDKTVVELRLVEIYVLGCDVIVNLTLPRVKHLEMVVCNYMYLFFRKTTFVVNACESLESLRFYFPGVSVMNQRQLLIANKNLKTLELSAQSESFFNGLHEVVKFELEHFSMRFSCEDNSQWKPRLNQFLMAQSPHISSISLYGWINADILKTILRMPQIKTFQLNAIKRIIRNIDMDQIESETMPNVTLKELILTDDLIDMPNIWQSLLRITRNVDHFQLYNDAFDNFEEFLSIRL